MSRLVTSIGADSSRLNSEDRVEIRDQGDRVVIALADGAGGQSGGARAAEFAVQSILRHVPILDPAAWVSCLAEIDRQLLEDGHGGETTAVAAVITADVVVGASVGDSGAWFIGAGGYENLTAHQQRKPLLGSGVAVPVLFQFGVAEGTLLIATDGLLKYTSAETICEKVRWSTLENAPRILIDLVRLKSGALQDDVAVALCRRCGSRP
jgi:PPM family protein phosphatase